MSSAGVVGRRERRREVVSPGVRSAERASPMGSAASEVSGEEGLVVSIETGAESSLRCGDGFARTGGGVTPIGGVVGRQEVRSTKAEEMNNNKRFRRIKGAQSLSNIKNLESGLKLKHVKESNKTGSFWIRIQLKRNPLEV